MTIIPIKRPIDGDEEFYLVGTRVGWVKLAKVS